MRRTETLALPTLLILAFTCRGLPAQENPLQEFLAAFRAGDTDALEAIATDGAVDPFRLAYDLFGNHVHGSLQQPPAPGDFLQAAGALATAARSRKANRALPALVAKWQALEPSALEREMRIHQAATQIRALLSKRKLEEALAAGAALGERLPAAAPAGLAAYHARCAIAEAHAAARQWSQAAACFRAAAGRALRLGWPVGAGVLLSRIGELHSSAGTLPEALAAFGEELAVWEDLDERAAMAAALTNIGMTQLRMGRAREGIAPLERAIALRRELGDRAGAARTSQYLGAAWLNSDPARARKLIEEALAEFEAIGDRGSAARTSLSLANLHYRSGEYAQAGALLEKALAVMSELGDRRSVASIRGNLGQIELVQGRLERALEHYRFERQGYEALNDRAGLVRAHLHLGLVHLERAETEEAIAAFEHSLREAEETGLKPSEIAALLMLGGAHLNRGDVLGALPYYRRARVEARAIGDRSREVTALGSLGLVHMDLGEYASALEHLEEALAGHEALDQEALAVEVLHNLGIVYFELRLYEEAERHFSKALRIFEASGDDRSAATARSNLGNVRAASGDHEEAIRCLQRATEEQERLGDRVGAAITRGNLGLSYRELARLDEAERCLEAALRQQRELGNPGDIGRTLQFLGLLRESQGDLDAALACHEEARAAAAAVGDRFLEAEQLHHLAKVHLRTGAAGACMALAEQSVRARLLLGQSLGEMDTPGVRADARQTAALGLLAAREIAEACAGEERDAALARAVRFTEWGRALALAESLRNRDALLAAHLPQALRAAESSARLRVTTLQKELLALATEKPAEVAALTEASTRLDGAYAGLQEVVARIQREARRIAQVSYPQPVALDALREQLPEKSALLLYHASGTTESREILLIVVRRAATQLVTLGDLEVLGPRIENYLRLASLPGSDPGIERALARALYEDLLRPAEEALGGADTLLISPDGILAFLPFEALLRSGGEREQRALERFDVAYIPSGTVYATLGEESRGAPRGVALLALGDPLYPGEEHERGPALAAARLRGVDALDRLPASGEEVRAISALFPEDRRTVLLRETASLAELRQQLDEAPQRLRALHLACHGHVDAARPQLTGLVLAGGEILGLHDLYRLRIPAELVVLSGCETARGKLERAEGVIGLVRGFFFAGAPRVVVTNWKVADEGARDLMVAFYSKMIRAGLAPGAALRAAKLERLRFAEHAHPYHWAGYVLWGLSE